jgi:hypothetical protein
VKDKLPNREYECTQPNSTGASGAHIRADVDRLRAKQGLEMCKSIKIARLIPFAIAVFPPVCCVHEEIRIRIESKYATSILADRFDTHGYRIYLQEYSLNVKIILLFCMGSEVGNAKWQESRINMYISILGDGVKFISHKEQMYVYVCGLSKLKPNLLNRAPTSPAGLGPENDCAGEGRQQL